MSTSSGEFVIFVAKLSSDLCTGSGGGLTAVRMPECEVMGIINPKLLKMHILTLHVVLMAAQLEILKKQAFKIQENEIS